MRAATFLSAALALSGCVNQAAYPPTGGYAGGSALAETAEYNRCKAWVTDSMFDRIRSRIGEEPTVAQLADSGRPNAADRGLLLHWAGILGECRTKGFAVPPAGVSWEQFQVALASLVAGEITYGGYNRKIVELRSAAKEQATAERERAAATAVATQAGVQAAIEQARAQAAADALADSIAAGITAAIFSSGRRR